MAKVNTHSMDEIKFPIVRKRGGMLNPKNPERYQSHKFLIVKPGTEQVLCQEPRACHGWLSAVHHASAT